LTRLGDRTDAGGPQNGVAGGSPFRRLRAQSGAAGEHTSRPFGFRSQLRRARIGRRYVPLVSRYLLVLPDGSPTAPAAVLVTAVPNRNGGCAWSAAATGTSLAIDMEITRSSRSAVSTTCSSSSLRAVRASRLFSVGPPKWAGRFIAARCHHERQMLPLAKRLVRLSRARRRSQSSSLTEMDRDDGVTAAGREHLAAITEDYGHFPARPTTGATPQGLSQSRSVPGSG
jgi:hypothetical protein